VRLAAELKIEKIIGEVIKGRISDGRKLSLWGMESRASPHGDL
jgi:hypothetical protein